MIWMNLGRWTSKSVRSMKSFGSSSLSLDYLMTDQDDALDLRHGASIRWDHPDLAVDSDTSRRARYRQLQSRFREEVLGIGVGLDSREIRRPNMLPRAAVSERPHLNFLSPAIGEYARARASVVGAEHGTLEEDRLYRNMLSSMPMCFNLFGQLRVYPQSAARLLSDALELDIAAVSKIDVEWTPKGEHPLGDRTAFDAFVEYITSDGKRGFLGVETKYTEPFSHREYDKPSYRRWSGPKHGFVDGAAHRLMQRKTNQLWRNLLLVIATRHEQDYAHGHVVVIAPADDRGASKALDGVRAQMVEPKKSVRGIDLESLMARAAEYDELSAWARRFSERYLAV